MKLIMALDYPQVHFGEFSIEKAVSDGKSGGMLPAGQYAYAIEEEKAVLLLRDPLGCNKLFFGFRGRQDLVVANRIIRAWELGVSLNNLYSCPPGYVLRVRDEGITNLGGTDVASITEAEEDFDLHKYHQAVEKRLGKAFKTISRNYENSKFVVCLSGGLDSAIIASYAARYLPNPVAVSFTYLAVRDLKKFNAGESIIALASASADYLGAARVAESLGMPLLPIAKSPKVVANAVSLAVALGQDWRDFNVHCATVNVFLAEGIRTLFPGEKIVVLTGDLMNEFVCDYEEETVDSQVYYRLPDIPIDRLRHFLVRGLDVGDREIGVFNAFGLCACQPFAAVADELMRVPVEVLKRPDAKRFLNGGLLPVDSLKWVNPKKSRAQVGGEDIGTLRLYHRLTISQEKLKQIWIAQFPGEPLESHDGLVEFGRYKSPRYATME